VRWVIGSAALLLLAAGYGSTLAAGDGASTMTASTAPRAVLAAPPMQKVDRPADDLAFLWEPNGRGASSMEICAQFSISGPADTPPQTTTTSTNGSCDSLSDAEKAQIHVQEQTYLESIRPAAPPRIVAELGVGADRTVELAAWSNTKGELCLGADSRTTSFSSTGGPFGPCAVGTECDGGLCLDEVQTDNAGRDFALAGVVPAAADRISLTVRGGETRAYPLDGPLVPGFPSSRVFMVDLGPDRYRRIVASAGGSVLATIEKEPVAVAAEECSDEPEAQTDIDVLRKCMEARGFGGPIGATRTAAPAGG
jgi:hypothetical protein